jgi:uncharacterized membrane protein
MENDDPHKPTDPSKFYWGIFYFNREDKRLLPPKRVPFLGWTVNWANPYSVLLLVAFIAGALLIKLFCR